ncbi:hypothetical protein R1flu_014553 [Riccia fluitans]|uniref:Uncharacterized protein n=1 Tax=Riccia fluitans TaxID=41844 RepID=A0ABD1YGJ3_9MARC
MRSIFDFYVNPTNDPNVQPLVKGLDADDFFVDKFFGLQDPTSIDDAQASPDFEEDLRTNERFPGTHDQEAIFHVLSTILCLTMPIDPDLVQMGIMNVEQQQDGHVRVESLCCKCSLVPPRRSQKDWIDVLGRRGLDI